MSPSRPLGWLALGLAALFLSSLGAFFLVLCRLPGSVSCSGAGFSTLLVYHVDFAVLVWFLAMAGAFLQVTGPCGPLQRPALLLAWAGAATLLLAPAWGESRPILSNYFPVLESPLFLAGLLLLGGSALLMSLDRLLQGTRQTGVAASCWAILSALAAFAVSSARTPWPADPLAAFESLFWAGGHLLQNAHVLLLGSLWLWLQQRQQPAFRPPAALDGLFVLATLPSLAGVLLSLQSDALFTPLMRWTSWWVVPGICGILLIQWRNGARPEIHLALSLLLMGLGLALGSVVVEQTLLVPAHYHGTVGAVTLGYMGLVHHLLESAEATAGRWRRWQPPLFALGVALLVAGLAVAGFAGLPRKTPGVEHPWEGAATLGMGLAAAGGLLFILASLLFVLQNLPRWWQLQEGRKSGLLALTGLLLLAIAGGIEVWPNRAPVAPAVPPAAEGLASAKPLTGLERRFQEGVVMLHAKQYEHALTAFHQVLKEAPQLPEAHLNMGYALLGLGRAKAARDFFLSAIDLRPAQANAYFGLAEALEAMGALREALGAMRAFVHLTRGDDPFLPRARAALWEWEARIKGIDVPTPKP
ncbi:MAG: hypothetical protein HQL56_08980 [Magnetococcales bacterium]|nr:hypothetical protein [Magnetococcales bacterium]